MRLEAWLVCLLVSVAPAGAEVVRIELTHPERGQALFGEMILAAEVSGDESIQRVEFWINDRRVASLEGSPYRTRVNVGEDNIARTISAVAYGISGTRTSSTQVFPEVVIDLAMELRLNQIYLTVTRDREPVLDLHQSDLTVFDNGLPQEIVTFERGDIPMTVALLIDASSSMTGPSYSAALAAARGFLARLDPLDDALVMAFSDRVLGISKFASGEQTLPEAFDRIRPGGGTAINDHLYAALRLLDGRQGKPVVILLSDGSDTVSALRMEDVQWKVRRSNSLVYRLQVTGSALHGAAFNSVWRTIAGNRVESRGLLQAIEATGGRVRRIARIAELERALDGVLLELRQQYALGYYPSGSSRSGEWRPIHVEVSSPELVIRTRQGYVAR